MTPEQKAREAIDQRLIQSGWILQDMRQLNPMAAPGVAVREFPTSTVNSTPIVRQYGILLTNGVLFYAKRETK